MRSALKRSAIGIVPQNTLCVFDYAVLKMNIGRYIRVIGACEIVYQLNQIVAPFLAGKLLIFPFYNGLSVGIISGAVGIHIFHTNIDTADTEQIAGGVQNATANKQILYVDTCDTIVTRFEKAILDQRIFRTMKMDSVRSAEAGDLAHGQIFAIVGFMQKVSAMSCRISFKQHVFTTAKEYCVRTAVALFTVGIVAIYSVNDRIHLSDNRNVFLSVSGDDRSAVGFPRCSVILRDQLHVRAHFYACGNVEHLVIVAVITTVKLCASLKIKRGIRPHTKRGGVKSALGDNDFAAIFFAKIKYRLYFRSLKLGNIRNNTVIGDFVGKHCLTPLKSDLYLCIRPRIDLHPQS